MTQYYPINLDKITLYGGPFHDQEQHFAEGKLIPVTLEEDLGTGYRASHTYIPWLLRGEYVWAYDRLCAEEILKLMAARKKEVLAVIEKRRAKEWYPFVGQVDRPKEWYPFVPGREDDPDIEPREGGFKLL